MSVDLAEPFATALRYATAPYAQGVATQALTLGPAAAGVSAVAPYDFSAFRSRYGVQTAALDVSYVLTLGADQTSSPALVNIGWVGGLGEGVSHLLVPACALAGESFGLPGLPSDPSLALTSLTEEPPPPNGAPAGPDKWSLTALMGNGARLLWALTGEAQTVAATARDVAAQSHIAIARGGSLDHIGAGLGVPRLLAAPYRLDYDTDTIALYHLDDLTAPVLDAAHDNPGVSVGATRGVAAKFGEAAQITASGAITIPDAIAFAIDPAVGFTVEMFANLAAAPAAADTVAFAQKRPRFGQSDSPGWALALEPAGAGHALAFTLTDSAGVVVRAAASATLPVGSWFHVAGVIDPAAGQARVLLNGAAVASFPLGALALVDTGADVGLGGDSFGASHLNGAIDEVRFSSVARTDFSTVLGASPEPYSRGLALAAARLLERIAARLAAVSPASALTVQIAAYPPPPLPGETPPTNNDDLGLAFALTLATAGPDFHLGKLGALAFEAGAPYALHQAPSGGTPSLRIVATPGDALDLEPTSFGGGPNPGLDLSGRQIVILGQATTISIARPLLAFTGSSAAEVDWSLLPVGPAAGTLGSGASAGSVVVTGTGMGVATLQARCTLADGVTVLTGSIDLVIAPESLDGCDSLGGDGTPSATEASESGGSDPDFRIDYLVADSDASVDYATPAARRMQLPLANALHNLATLAAREPGAPRVTVLAAYDPTQSTLQSVGCGLVVAPSGVGLTAGRLAALAFLAGFSYIERRRYPASAYLSVPAGQRFEIVAGPLRRLWPNGRISGHGAYMATEFKAAGPLDNPFNPGILQPFADPRVTFAAGVSNSVQAVLATALAALLAAIAADGATGTLQVIGGFVSGNPTLLGVGRAVLARHSVVTPDRLAGYALQAGFGFVDHAATTPGGAAIYMAAYPSAGPPPNLLNNADPNAAYHEVGLNDLVQLSVQPQLPIAGRLDWSAQAVCPAAAGLSTALPDPSDAPGMTEQVFQATLAGAVAAVSTFSLNDFSDPYQFTITPLAGPGGAPPRLSKDQYDDLLNFLDACHPLGVAGLTRQLRGYVHGFQRPARWDRLPTSQTYPRYRGGT